MRRSVRIYVLVVQQVSIVNWFAFHEPPGTILPARTFCLAEWVDIVTASGVHVQNVGYFATLGRRQNGSPFSISIPRSRGFSCRTVSDTRVLNIRRRRSQLPQPSYRLGMRDIAGTSSSSGLKFRVTWSCGFRVNAQPGARSRAPCRTPRRGRHVLRPGQVGVACSLIKREALWASLADDGPARLVSIERHFTDASGRRLILIPE